MADTPAEAEFYAASLARMWSGESDYGVHWRFGTAPWPTWRVSYIRDTGEVYATRGGQPGRVVVLGTVPADPGGYWYKTLDQILDGYADPAVTRWRLSWVSRRLAAARQEVTTRG